MPLKAQIPVATECEPQRARRFDALWFAFWLVASSMWCLAAANAIGVTFDEKYYVSYGLNWWHGEALRVLVAGTMPLPTDLQTLTILLWEIVRGQRFNTETDFLTILPVARAANLIFWWIFLFYGWRIGRLLGGRWTANFALAFLACEPNFLAHASLATTDTALAACLLGFAYHYRVGGDAERDNWKARVLWPLLWGALSLVAKASAVFYMGAIVFVVEAELACRGRNVPSFTWGTVRELLATIFARENRREWLQIGGGALVLMLLYCGVGGKTHPVLVQRAAASAPGTQHEILSWLATHARIYPSAIDALYLQAKHNAVGHPWFLLGQSDMAGWVWYYFPVVLTIKASLPLIVAAVIVLWRPRAVLNWVGVCALVFLLMTLQHHVQNGVRHLFALMALAAIAIAAAWVNPSGNRATAPARLHRRHWPLVALTVWMLFQAAFIWPHGQLYVNSLWGGTENGYLLVGGPNYDAGQGLPELEQWKQQNGVENLALWYFGSDPIAKRITSRRLPFDFRPANEQELRARVKGQYLAISTSVLYAGYKEVICNEKLCNPGVATLRKMKPVGRTSTFLIFDFT